MMQFAKQSIDIPVGNMDERTSTSINTPKLKRHSDLLPNNLRCIIAGPSGCGKTNILISLIESEHGLKFENLYLYSKTLDQEKYKYLLYDYMYGYFSSSAVFTFGPKLTKLPIVPSSVIVAS